jgi:hypothetical protein
MPEFYHARPGNTAGVHLAAAADGSKLGRTRCGAVSGGVVKIDQ